MLIGMLKHFNMCMLPLPLSGKIIKNIWDTIA